MYLIAIRPAYPSKKPPNEQSTLATVYLAGLDRKPTRGEVAPRVIVDFAGKIKLDCLNSNPGVSE